MIHKSETKLLCKYDKILWSTIYSFKMKYMQSNNIKICSCVVSMGVGRIFSRGATRDFFKIFVGGLKNGEICIFLFKAKKTTIFC